MSRIVLAAVASCLMITGALSQDGARAYFLLPEDTDILSLTGTLLHAEAAGSQFGVIVVTTSYRHSIDVAGNAGAILVGLPVGSLSASLDTGMGIVDLDTDLAQGDLILAGELGLLGSPSLAPMDYAQYKPGLRAGIAAKLFLPTGDYDSSRLLNMGGNRWSLEASLPISYVLADTMLDPELTTFEIVPSVQIFGDNNDPSPLTDPSGLATVSSQEPLWTLEGHITRTFGPTVWVALDGYYVLGGQVSADGVPVGTAKESLSLGATLGLVLSPSVALRLSYLEQVYSNVPNSVARGVQLASAFAF
jgi:hypothetical protein